MSSPVTTIAEIGKHDGQSVTLRGWLYNLRESGKLLFPQFRDGSGVIQGVVPKNAVTPEVFEAIKTLTRPHEKVFLTHVGPIALSHVRKVAHEKARSASRKTTTRRRRNMPASPMAPAAPVEHVIAMDYEKARPSTFVKALGTWIGRVAHGGARRVG